uniref:Glycosyltransferase family 92 protein n=1 Tax=Strongyloides venezuelensis TaxID=75913 RepID=A0A0K0F5D0_STRVS
MYIEKENIFYLEDSIPEENVCIEIKKNVNIKNNKIDEKKEYPFAILSENPSEQYIPKVAFTRRAFLISNNTIEVPLITTKSFAHNNNNLFLIEGNVDGNIKCQWGRKCPEYYYHGCIFTGYVATFKLPPTHMFSSNNLLLSTSKFIHLWSKTSNQTYTIPLYNSTSILLQTPNSVYKHFLAVFVQPLYYMSDFHIMIQFFEYWITQGATKVYIGRTSYTKDIEKTIKWYNDNKWIEIEFIEWPILPNIYRPIDTQYNKYNQDFNPNLFTFQYEAILSIYDAMHYIRSLRESKYVAVFDWDEIIVLKNNQTRTVTEFLKNQENNSYIAWSFESRRVTLKKNYNVDSLEDVNFLYFENARIDTKPFKRPAYQKNIYRPEFINRFHVHLVDKKLPSDKINYVINKEAEIYHLRRMPDIEKKFNQSYTNILKETGQILTNNFKLKLQKDPSITEQKTWNNYFNDITRNLENCRQNSFKESFSHKYGLCVSVEACSKYLNLTDKLDWITSKEKWIIIN